MYKRYEYVIFFLVNTVKQYFNKQVFFSYRLISKLDCDRK